MTEHETMPSRGSLLFAKRFTGVTREARHPNDDDKYYIGSIPTGSPVIFLGDSKLVRRNFCDFSRTIECLTIFGIGWIMFSTLSEVSDDV